MILCLCCLMTLSFQHVLLFHPVLFLLLFHLLRVHCLQCLLPVLLLAVSHWTFLLLRLGLGGVLREGLNLLDVGLLLALVGSMQDAQILTGVVVIGQFIGSEPKEIDEGEDVDHLPMMGGLGLVHLPVVLQDLVDLRAIGDVLVTDDAHQDMEKYDILGIFELLVLVLQQFAVLAVDLAQQVVVDQQSYLTEIQGIDVLGDEIVGNEHLNVGQLQLHQFAELKELKRWRVVLPRLGRLYQCTGHFYKGVHADDVEVLAVPHPLPQLAQQVQLLRLLQLAQPLRVGLIVSLLGSVNELGGGLHLTAVGFFDEVQPLHE